MNRIKEHLDEPSAVEVIRQYIGRMPLNKRDGGEISYGQAAFALGVAVCGLKGHGILATADGLQVSGWLSQFSTAQELVDAIWGKEGGE
jgi:hypothetical protein